MVSKSISNSAIKTTDYCVKNNKNLIVEFFSYSPGMEEEDINKFLYGDELPVEEEPTTINNAEINKEGEEHKEVKEEEVMKEEVEEEEDDDFEIVLEDSNRRGLTNITLGQPVSSPTTPAVTLPSSLTGAIGTLDLNGIGSIAGQSIYDVDLDDETGPAGDRPWRKPGADITDYFNYGFNEVTWRMYCLRQRVLREEYGNSKNNNIPAALANNPLILQGLFPKGGK